MSLHVPRLECRKRPVAPSGEVAALAGRPAAQFDRRRRHGRGYLAAATLLTVIMALLAVSGELALAPAAHAACPVNDPACGPPGAPDDPPPDDARFGWTLHKLRPIVASDETNGAAAETNFDRKDESSTSPVTLNACSSTATKGIRAYRWTIDDGTSTSTITSSVCQATWHRPLSHDYATADVTLTVLPKTGSGFSITHRIRYRDVVIASLGDSAASGQGASERLQFVKPAFLVSEDCDRSGWAASAQAALRVQTALPDATVHFWHLACAGASITAQGSSAWHMKHEDAGGMIDPYTGTDHTVHPPLKPQLRRLAELRTQTALPVDRLLLTVGANDTHWATVASACLPLVPVAQHFCLDGYAAKIVAAVRALPAHFDELNASLPDSLVPHNNVYLTEYFDPLDSLSAQAPDCGGEPFASQYMRVWGTSRVEDPLQNIVNAAASRFHWNPIGGIREAFQGHGVCHPLADRWNHPLADRWINSAADSIANQADQNGSWHANRKGQQVMANIVYNAISFPTPQPSPPADLYFVKTKNTGTGHVEVHIATSRSGYQSSGGDWPTWFSSADADNGFFQSRL